MDQLDELLMDAEAALQETHNVMCKGEILYGLANRYIKKGICKQDALELDALLSDTLVTDEMPIAYFSTVPTGTNVEIACESIIKDVFKLAKKAGTAVMDLIMRLLKFAAAQMEKLSNCKLDNAIKVTSKTKRGTIEIMDDMWELVCTREIHEILVRKPEVLAQLENNALDLNKVLGTIDSMVGILNDLMGEVAPLTTDIGNHYAIEIAVKRHDVKLTELLNEAWNNGALNHMFTAMGPEARIPKAPGSMMDYEKGTLPALKEARHRKARFAMHGTVDNKKEVPKTYDIINNAMAKVNKESFESFGIGLSEASLKIDLLKLALGGLEVSYKREVEHTAAVFHDTDIMQAALDLTNRTTNRSLSFITDLISAVAIYTKMVTDIYVIYTKLNNTIEFYHPTLNVK